MKFRQRIVRLAMTNPKLRQHLVGLLKQAGGPEVQLIDGEDGSVVWAGYLDELLEDNDDLDPREIRDLQNLRRGQQTALGGGAGAAFIVRRVR